MNYVNSKHTLGTAKQAMRSINKIIRCGILGARQSPAIHKDANRTERQGMRASL